MLAIVCMINNGQQCLNYALLFTLLRFWYTILIAFASGNIMKELRDPAQRHCKSYVYDMAVDGDILIVLRYDENKILYYRLIFE